jgi:Domain of unknown function (DUF397)
VDPTSAAWRTSSYSGGNGGQCIQVTALASPPGSPGPLCAVRDSRNPSGPVLTVAARQWHAFTAAIKAGRPA